MKGLWLVVIGTSEKRERSSDLPLMDNWCESWVGVYSIATD